MVKRARIDDIIATTVDLTKQLTETTSSENKKKKYEFFINKKDEFMLTYANTYHILTKLMVKNTLDNLDAIERYIICIEKCHNTDDHEHIHVYLKMRNKKFSTRDKRYFDVFNDGFNNESHSNHPNIKYKGDYCFGKAKRGDQATYDMIKYVLKEDTEVLSNWDYNAWLEWFELHSKKDTRKVTIPFFEWVHEDPKPLQEEIYERIRGNQEWFQNYLDYFLQINGMIKNEFPSERPVLLEPNFELKFYIPKEIKDWINAFEDWWKNGKPGERFKGLWITGCTRSAKTSLIATLGPNNYFPNIWNMENFRNNSKFNFFDDQDWIFETIEDFKLFKGFVGSQNVITIGGKYKKPKTVTNGIPCIWCSNMRFEDQCKSKEVRDFIRNNMIVYELGRYDLRKNNYPNSKTLGGMGWSDYDPKDSYYYFLKEIEKTTNWDKYRIQEEESTNSSLNVEPPTSPIVPIEDGAEIKLLDGSSESSN